MSNIVRNQITFESSVTAIRIFNKVETKGEFDFNKLIPMPESLDIESGSQLDKAIVLYEMYSHLPLSLLDDDSHWPTDRIEKEFHELFGSELKGIAEWNAKQPFDYLGMGEKAYKNYQMYGAKTWYEWRIKHWGTKWNAFSTHICDRTISFETAWSMPRPILDALMPLITRYDSFVWTWADENTGYNTGEISVKDGKIESEVRPEGASNTAYELYVKCWGESDCVGKDEDGNYIFYNCDNCPNSRFC